MKPQTETLNESALGLDVMPDGDVLSLLLDAQIEAGKSVRTAMPQIEAGAKAVSNSVKSNGRLVYAAAGSSALMALADGLELPGTFGISNERIEILMAGGKASLDNMLGGPEDDAGQGAKDIEQLQLTDADCVICVSASGATPYALGAQTQANADGATTIAIANNDQSALLDEADIAIRLLTPPEIVAGSTRMGAATAQKIALNMMSTLMAVHLGHIHDGHMVNVKADNLKLQQRACNMIVSITNCSIDEAKGGLERAEGSVKLAILLVSGAKDLADAKAVLANNEGRLRTSLLAF